MNLLPTRGGNKGQVSSHVVVMVEMTPVKVRLRHMMVTDRDGDVLLGNPRLIRKASRVVHTRSVVDAHGGIRVAFRHIVSVCLAKEVKKKKTKKKPSDHRPGNLELQGCRGGLGWGRRWRKRRHCGNFFFQCFPIESFRLPSCASGHATAASFLHSRITAFLFFW